MNKTIKVGNVELEIKKSIICRGYDIYYTNKGWKVFKDGVIDSAQDSEDACYSYVDRQKKIAAAK